MLNKCFLLPINKTGNSVLSLIGKNCANYMSKYLFTRISGGTDATRNCRHRSRFRFLETTRTPSLSPAPLFVSPLLLKKSSGSAQAAATLLLLSLSRKATTFLLLEKGASIIRCSFLPNPKPSRIPSPLRAVNIKLFRQRF
jgi:hypothetical protein